MKGFLVVLAVGLVLLLIASLRDRRSRRDVESTVGLPLERLVPRPLSSADERQREEMSRFRQSATAVDGRLADERFATWSDPLALELADPAVLCCPDGLASQRELLDALARARREARPLLVVGPAIDEELAALLAASPRRDIHLVVAPAKACVDVAMLSGARPAPRGDLQAGLGGASLGRLERVLATPDGCWVRSVQA
ncbi:hypothetical protein ACTQ49_09270 [Luteococcus sp. Sow4_B9]|uniref:hypothetical protein n=1 Tax=Luteococcus sp. Sow4_B9 TaxID=3438792 RepID=UPI003F99E44B